MINVNEWIKVPLEERCKHIDLSEQCLERGGNSTNHKGVLAQYLDTTIPQKRLLLCHKCNNPKCSNPRHLYWGTDKENTHDALECGNRTSFWDNAVKKYGYEQACKMNSNNARKKLKPE